MLDPQLEDNKDLLIQTLTDAYAEGSMDMAAFERAVTRISSCADPRSLAAEADSLGIGKELVASGPRTERSPAERPLGAIDLDCVSGNIRKSGQWVKAGVYRIRLKSSSARLDLSEYEGARGFHLVLEIEAASSTVRLIVPKGFDVEDRFGDRISSVVRNKPRDDSFGGNRIVLTGSIRSSTVKVKYR